MVKPCDESNHKEIALELPKSLLYIQIRDFLHDFKKEDFKSLIRKRELKNFIDETVETAYERVQFFVCLGIFEESAHEIVLNDLFLNKLNKRIK